MTEMEALQKKCLSCFGSGEVGGLYGPQRCNDCDGSGRPPRRHLLTERRIREIEARVAHEDSESAMATRWLAFELRRAREGLTKIVTLASESNDPSAMQLVFHIANNVLGVFEPESVREPRRDAGVVHD